MIEDRTDGAVDGTGETKRVYVLGDDSLSRVLARRYDDASREVTYVDCSGETSLDASPNTHSIDGVDGRSLGSVAPDPTDVVVIACADDARNLLAATIVRTIADPDRVVVLVNDPDRLDLVAEQGFEAVDAVELLSTELVDRR